MQFRDYHQRQRDEALQTIARNSATGLRIAEQQGREMMRARAQDGERQLAADARNADRVVASQEWAAEQAVLEEERTREAMQEGFKGLAAVTAYGLERLGARFDRGAAMILAQLQVQDGTLQDILRTLKTPTRTQALEFKEIGLENIRKGLYDGAIKEFRKSTALYDYDFEVHQALGQILSASGHPGHDLRGAAEEFRLAAEYARIDAPKVAALCWLQRHYALVDVEDVAGAYEATAKALDLTRGIGEIVYRHAVAALRLGRVEQGITHLREALDVHDPRFSIKVFAEPGIDPVRPHVHALMVRMRDECATTCRADMATLTVALKELGTSGLLRKEDGPPFLRVAQDLKAAGARLARNTYLDALDARGQLNGVGLEHMRSALRGLAGPVVGGGFQTEITWVPYAVETIAKRRELVRARLPGATKQLADALAGVERRLAPHEVRIERRTVDEALAGSREALARGTYAECEAAVVAVAKAASAAGNATRAGLANRKAELEKSIREAKDRAAERTRAIREREREEMSRWGGEPTKPELKGLWVSLSQLLGLLLGVVLGVVGQLVMGLLLTGLFGESVNSDRYYFMAIAWLIACVIGGPFSMHLLFFYLPYRRRLARWKETTRRVKSECEASEAELQRELAGLQSRMAALADAETGTTATLALPAPLG